MNNNVENGNFWSKDSLLAKAQIYSNEMHLKTPDDWGFGLFAALSLEFLARAALSSISPVLLADQINWRNVLYAVDGDITAKKFIPSSIGTKEVFNRLTELVPEFTIEVSGFCSRIIEKRNAELHTGEVVFADAKTSDWLPKYYKACEVLLKFLGSSLEAIMPDAKKAKEMIESLNDATAKAIDQEVKAYAKVWSGKSDEERELLSKQAEIWATRQSGHRVTCPACGSRGLLQGAPHGSVTTETRDDEIVQRQTMLPTAFECVACKLKIGGFSKLLACGLGDAYTETSTYLAAEFFNLYTEDEVEEAKREERYRHSSYEEDNNE